MSPRLETLLTRYEADLMRFVKGTERGFLCPICLRFYSRSEDHTENISIEHIVPSALGGTATTLTCRQCNNTAGSQLESHLIQRVQVEGGMKPIDARVEFCGTAFRAEVHLPNSTGHAIELAGIQKQSDPREIAKFGNLLSEGIWDGQNLKLDLELGYAPLRSLAALVRSAYLLMFRLFGYRYVFDRSAAVIRQSIAEPLVETDVLKGVLWRGSFRPPAETSVSIVTEPKEFRSYMIFLTLDENHEHVSAITLPPPNTGAEFFHTLGKVGNPTTFNLRHLGSGRNEEILPLDEVWQYVTNDGG